MLLSNDLLLDRLASATDHVQVQQQVELAMARENASLLEERAALEKELAQQQVAVSRLQMEQGERAAAHEAEMRQRETDIAEVTRRRQEFEHAHASQMQEAEELAERARQADEARAEAEQRAKVEALRRTEAEAISRRNTLVASLATGVAGVALFELLVHVLPWIWLVQHPNSLGLQVAFVAAIGILIRAIFYPHWRPQAIGAGFVLLIAALAILGR
jgi:hypothetical protein